MGGLGGRPPYQARASGSESRLLCKRGGAGGRSPPPYRHRAKPVRSDVQEFLSGARKWLICGELVDDVLW